ncbi:DUF917 domain-containing protein [Pseudonocardia acaciae]|uniref:DUF917 domain-containing protein n=1 Tax=Pseudonocardia acaciae TaxID=551276 RepID=UPI0006878C76|nr:DUF917 domain-containing protein [Pseudonocardia acaciae]
MTIGPDDLDDLMLGGTLYASGGGRRTSATVTEWTHQVLTERGPVPLLDATELAPGTLCAAVGMAGSAALFEELLPSGDEFVRAVRALEHHLRASVGAIVPLNTGGSNAVLPVSTARLLGVPLVDADGIGRTFSLLEGTTYRLGGVSPTPMALAGTGGETAVIETPVARLEAVTRPFVLACGGWAAAAMYPMTAARLAETGIRHSVSRTLRAGRTLREAGALSADAIAHRLGATRLVTGRVLTVTPHEPLTESAQPARPVSIVVRERAGLRRVVRLEARNEIAVAWTDGAVAASAPDCFCLLGLPGHHLLDIERVEAGMDLEVLVLPAAERWHSPEGLAVAGPRAFGFDVP